MEYQPKQELAGHRITQAEALLRWNHPILGRISPDEFVAIAEKSGQIRLLTHWVIDTVMGQQAAWSQKWLDIAVAINLSMLDLSDQDLPQVIRSLRNRHRCDPAKIIFEITESAIMRDLTVTTQVLEEIQEIGFQIAIDDFGTGYSSLVQLKRLPVNELKIDQSFVKRLELDDDDAAIVRSTIDMAHTMGLKVVAEGVENQNIQNILRAWKCDMIQGYHLSRPLGPNAFAEWMQRIRAAEGLFEPLPETDDVLWAG